MNKRGFTLLELVLVTALILVFSSLAFPRLQGTYQNLELRNKALSLQKLIEMAQHRAVTHRSTLKMDTPERGEFIRMSQMDKSGTYNPIEDKFFRRLNFKEPWSVQMDPKEIFFYPDGTSDSGEILLSFKDINSFKLTIQASGNRVDVEQLSQES